MRTIPVKEYGKRMGKDHLNKTSVSDLNLHPILPMDLLDPANPTSSSPVIRGVVTENMRRVLLILSTRSLNMISLIETFCPGTRFSPEFSCCTLLILRVLCGRSVL